MTAESSTLKVKPPPVAYKKSTLRDDYMAYPSNAVAFSRVDENKGKLILALGLLNKIGVLDPDTGHMVREVGADKTLGATDRAFEKVIGHPSRQRVPPHDALQSQQGRSQDSLRSSTPGRRNPSRRKVTQQ